MDSSRAVANRIGRPAWKRSPQLAEQICSLLATGFSLRYSCSELGITPTLVFDWIFADPEFAKQYARAREIQAETLADVIVEMSDSAIGKKNEEVTAIRNAVEARKWVAAKLLPKKYGDNQAQVNFSQTNVHITMSVEEQKELQERRRRLLEE